MIFAPPAELKELMPDLILPSATSPQDQPAMETATAEVESSHRQSKDMDLNQLEKLRAEHDNRAKQQQGRSEPIGPEARFLFYFFTSTVTSTSTSTTSTTSITFTNCTPATSIFSLCG